MGTRGIIGHKLNGTHYGAYNHYDSNPDGLGKEALEFIAKVNKDKGWATLKERIEALKYVKESDTPDVDIAKSMAQRYSNVSNAVRTKAYVGMDWYNLLRDIQGVGYYDEIYAGRLGYYIDSIDFIRDSLFCEYAYIMNLDDMTLDMYLGSQTKRQEGNPFAFKHNQIIYDEDTHIYYPCALIGTMPLEGITDAEKASQEMVSLYEEMEGAEEDNEK